MGDSKANIDNKKENDDVTIDPVICYNLSYFKDLMKEYRKLDDNIMLRLNSTDTHSQAACGAFFQQLAKA
ncbi:1922_t:CDS:2 [Ambispora gerdemannii]|uniref:1922_t:CDS:1 n=1 Tax=Ambispora gerdemannii TaxID=144530 RepID=A0A9N9FXP5_9GLOM|nr:1922_t:CDS:2 [Ambispora gerdemannii]